MSWPAPQVADLAYRDVEREISLLKQRIEKRTLGEIGMVGVGMLERMHDSRTAEAYMRYAILDHPFMGSKQALQPLSGLLPRPTQLLGQLQNLLESHEASESGPRVELDDQLLATIVLVGREESRPILEQLTRSKNEQPGGGGRQLYRSSKQCEVGCKPNGPVGIADAVKEEITGLS